MSTERASRRRLLFTNPTREGRFKTRLTGNLIAVGVPGAAPGAVGAAGGRQT